MSFHPCVGAAAEVLTCLLATALRRGGETEIGVREVKSEGVRGVRGGRFRQQKEEKKRE